MSINGLDGYLSFLLIGSIVRRHRIPPFFSSAAIAPKEKYIHQHSGNPLRLSPVLIWQTVFRIGESRGLSFVVTHVGWPVLPPADDEPWDRRILNLPSFVVLRCGGLDPHFRRMYDIELLMAYRTNTYSLGKAIDQCSEADTAFEDVFERVQKAMEAIASDASNCIVSHYRKTSALIDALARFFDRLGFVDVAIVLFAFVETNILLRVGRCVPTSLQLELNDAIIQCRATPRPQFSTPIWKDKLVRLMRHMMWFMQSHCRIVYSWMIDSVPKMSFFAEAPRGLLRRVGEACCKGDEESVRQILQVLETKIDSEALVPHRIDEAQKAMEEIQTNLDACLFDQIYSGVSDLCLLVQVSHCEQMFNARFSDLSPAYFALFIEEEKARRRGDYDESIGKISVAKCKSEALLPTLEALASQDVCELAKKFVSVMDRVYEADTMGEVLLITDDAVDPEALFPLILCGMLELLNQHEEAEALHCFLIEKGFERGCSSHNNVIFSLLQEAGFFSLAENTDMTPYILSAVEARCIARLGESCRMLQAMQVAIELRPFLPGVKNILQMAKGDLCRMLFDRYKIVVPPIPCLASLASSLENFIGNPIMSGVIIEQIRYIIDEFSRISDPPFAGFSEILAELREAVPELETALTETDPFETPYYVQHFIEQVRPLEKSMFMSFARVLIDLEKRSDSILGPSNMDATESNRESPEKSFDWQIMATGWCGC